MTPTHGTETTLITGGTGKTGRRVAQRLTARGLPVRIGSRSGEPPFDWQEPGSWEPALDGVTAVYVTYHPDLAFPGTAEAVGALSALAVGKGARRLVLLSGRGEEGAVNSENRLKDSGADWTVVRANWFNQNFSESSSARWWPRCGPRSPRTGRSARARPRGPPLPVCSTWPYS